MWKKGLKKNSINVTEWEGAKRWGERKSEKFGARGQNKNSKARF